MILRVSPTVLIPLLLAAAVRVRADDPAAQATPDRPGPTAAERAVESLDDLLEPVRREHELPALAAAVVRDLRLCAAGAVGVRRLGSPQPVELADRFHIGSCTKSMTATLCAILVEQGKLRWDTTIGETLPQLADDIRPEFREVTLEQLLCHRSGLPEDRAPTALLRKLRALDGDMRARRREMVRLVLSQPPAAEPGTRFAYSNAGFAIAATLAEQAADRPWEDLMRERLFAPLGMDSAGFGPPGDANELDQPWGHRTVFGKLRGVPPGPLADNPAVLAPGGGVHCSLPDWARYATLHLSDEARERRLLGTATFEKLHSDPYEQGYGFGWGIRVGERAGGKVLTHTGSNTMWYARAHLVPERRLALLVATNRGDEQSAEAMKAVIEALAERYAP